MQHASMNLIKASFSILLDHFWVRLAPHGCVCHAISMVPPHLANIAAGADISKDTRVPHHHSREVPLGWKATAFSRGGRNKL